MALLVAIGAHNIWAISFFVPRKSALKAFWFSGGLGTVVPWTKKMMTIGAVLMAIPSDMSLDGTFPAERRLVDHHFDVLAMTVMRTMLV